MSTTPRKKPGAGGTVNVAMSAGGGSGQNIQVPSNGVISSQSDNVVTFDWPPVHQKIAQETRFKILWLLRGLKNLFKILSG